MINHRYTYSTSTASTAPPATSHSLTRPQRPNLRIITSLSNKHTLLPPNPLPRLYDPSNLNGSIAAATAPLPLPSRNSYFQPIPITHTHGDFDFVHDTSQSRKIRKMRNREVYVYEEDQGESFLDMRGNLLEFTRHQSTASGMHGGIPDERMRSCSLLPATSGDSIIHSQPEELPPTEKLLGHKRKLSDKFKNLIGKARRMEHPSTDTGREMDEHADEKPVEAENVNHSAVNCGYAPTVHFPAQSRPLS